MTRRDFSRPPVVEVAIGAEFVSPAPLRVQAVLDLRDRLRDRYPKTDLLEPLPPLPPLDLTGSFVGLQLGPPSNRWWLISEDDSQLIQLQQDRLLLNWRRIERSSKYPRYHTLLPEFLHALGQVDALSGGLQVLSLQTDYYNMDDGASTGTGLSDTLTASQQPSLVSGPRSLVEMRISERLDLGERPAAVLIDARRDGDGPAYFSVSTRSEAGGLAGSDTNGVEAALEELHGLALQAFEAQISPAALERWT